MIQHFHVVVVPAGDVIFYVYLEFNHHIDIVLLNLPVLMIICSEQESCFRSDNIYFVYFVMFFIMFFIMLFIMFFSNDYLT